MSQSPQHQEVPKDPALSSFDMGKNANFAKLAQRFTAASCRSSLRYSAETRARMKRNKISKRRIHPRTDATMLSAYGGRPVNDWKGQLDGVEDILIEAVFAINPLVPSNSRNGEPNRAKTIQETDELLNTTDAETREEHNDACSCTSSDNSEISADIAAHHTTESPFVAALEPCSTLKRFSEMGFQGWSSLQTVIEEINAPISH